MRSPSPAACPPAPCLTTGAFFRGLSWAARVGLLLCVPRLLQVPRPPAAPRASGQPRSGAPFLRVSPAPHPATTAWVSALAREGRSRSARPQLSPGLGKSERPSDSRALPPCACHPWSQGWFCHLTSQHRLHLSARMLGPEGGPACLNYPDNCESRGPVSLPEQTARWSGNNIP